MLWETANEKDGGGYAIPFSWLQIHYYEALNILFRLENALRITVYCILKEAYRAEWLKQTLANDDVTEGTIESIAKRRISQASEFQYLCSPPQNPLMHLTLGELSKLVFSEKHWKLFSKLFPGKKDVIKNKFDEIIVIRNSFSHFRQLSQDDVDALKHNSRQAFSKIEKYIESLYSISKKYSKNTKLPWFISITDTIPIETPYNIFDSEDDNWVKVSIYNDLRYTRRIDYGTWFSQNTINIPVHNILSIFPSLKNNIIYVSENSPRITMQANKSFSGTKTINFVFSKGNVEAHHEEISKDFGNLLELIETETQEFLADENYRSKLLELIAIQFFQSKDDQPLRYKFSKPMSAMNENPHPEYWGTVYPAGVNFISQTDTYPWIMDSISNMPF